MIRLKEDDGAEFIDLNIPYFLLKEAYNPIEPSLKGTANTKDNVELPDLKGCECFAMRLGNIMTKPYG